MNYISMDIGTSNIKIIETDEKINVTNKMILEKIEARKNTIFPPELTLLSKQKPEGWLGRNFLNCLN